VEGIKEMKMQHWKLLKSRKNEFTAPERKESILTCDEEDEPKRARRGEEGEMDRTS
jgi:hypothetical protein